MYVLLTLLHITLSLKTLRIQGNITAGPASEGIN